MFELPTTEIRAVDIPDAWFQAVSKILKEGFKYEIQQGSFVGQTRLEFHHIRIVINSPYREPYDLMLPDVPPGLGIPNPVERGYVEQYIPFLMTDHIEPGEQYTYGSRIYPQITKFIDLLKKTPNTNQAILQIGSPDDYKLEDPPCLRHIDMRIFDGKLIFYPDYRSWDLWAGFPANLAGIAVLQKDMADQIGVDPGPICAVSKGLHIYGYAEEMAKIRCYVD